MDNSEEVEYEDDGFSLERLLDIGEVLLEGGKEFLGPKIVHRLSVERELAKVGRTVLKWLVSAQLERERNREPKTSLEDFLLTNHPRLETYALIIARGGGEDGTD